MADNNIKEKNPEEYAFFLADQTRFAGRQDGSPFDNPEHPLDNGGENHKIYNRWEECK